MASRDLADLHPDLVKVWQEAQKKWAELYPNYPVPFITCTYRSNEEQTKLYASGRTEKGKILTKAKAGESPHNYKPSLAFDIAFQKDKQVDWRPMLFEKFWGIVEKISDDVVWGGRFQTFGDKPHFEKKNWKSWK